MAAPGTPSNVYVQQGNGQVYLSWDLQAGATSYPVLRSTDGVTFAQVSDAAPNNYLDSSVTTGTLYYYQVQAKNVDGSSNASTAQTIIPTPTAEMSLGQLRLLSQQRADRVNSQFVTLPEWNSYINQSRFELYDLLVTVYEDYYLAPPYNFVTDGVSSQYTLPNGVLTDSVSGLPAAPFYKLQGLDLGLDSNTNAFVTLHKFEFISRNRYLYPAVTGNFYGVFSMRYRLMGNTVYFIPTPSGGQTVRVWYVPRLTELLQDTDLADGISGWTEYVIVDAAIKALQKEESDVSVLLAQKQALIKRIEESSMNRDAGQADSISRTRGWSGGWSDNGGGWDGSSGGM